jgi:hypothetical protein
MGYARVPFSLSPTTNIRSKCPIAISDSVPLALQDRKHPAKLSEFLPIKLYPLAVSVFVSSLITFSLVVGFIEPRAPWRWPLVMAYVHNFSGFYIINNWGQIPPLELFYIGVLALPGVATGYLGRWLRRRYENRTDN